MSEVRCTKTTDIGAYLLGGLSQDEAVSLRTHIDGCATCSAALAELRPLTDQLSQSDLRSFAGMDVEHPPTDLRERILASALAETPDAQVVSLDKVRAQSSRSRQAWKAASAVGVAFVLGAGSGYVAKPAAAPPKRYWGTGTKDIAQRVEFVSNTTSGPRAWANVVSGPAGTYAALYTKGLSAGETYRWWFEKTDGTRVGLGSFVFPANQTEWVICPGGTSVERIDLKAIGATNAAGEDVLRADLPAPATS